MCDLLNNAVIVLQTKQKTAWKRKKFHDLQETRSSVIIKTCQGTTTRASWIIFPNSYPLSFRSHLIIFCHICPSPQSLQNLQLLPCIHVPLTPCLLYRPPLSAFLNLPKNNIRNISHAVQN